MKRFLSILLSLMLTLTCVSAMAEPFDGVFDKTITATSIQEVVYLQGSWYEMGQQYALQQYDVLERVYMTSMKGMLASMDVEKIYAIVSLYMEEYRETHPDLYDFVRGVADQAQISLEDAAIATFCDRLDMDGANEKLEAAEACMHATVWGDMTRDGHLIGACNLDSGIDSIAQYASTLVIFPDNGYPVAAGAGLLSNACLNANGVMITYSGQKGGSKEIRKTDMVNSVAFLWYALAHAGTAEEAIAMLQSHDLYKEGNLCISDTKGNATVLENSIRAPYARVTGDRGEEGTYLVAANHFTFEELADYAYEPGAMDDSPVRVDTVERILLDNAGQVTVGTLARALGCREYYMDGAWSGENWDIDAYMYYSPEMSDFIDKTIIRTVMDANEGTLYTLRGHYDYYTSHVPDTTAQYTKITLGDSAARVNKSAGYDARLMTWYAAYDLDHSQTKNPDKAAYWNQANQKIQEALNYTLMAEYAQVKGQDVEALQYYGLATSAYCRAQQYAQAAQSENNTFMK